MGHKTLIDGVGYDITGGRCLDDGVGYNIQKGRTLEDGVGYDVLFKDEPIYVEITGRGGDRCYVTINGTQYRGATSGIEVGAGDEIIFHVGGHKGQASIDGIVVAGPVSSSSGSADYTWIVPTGISAVTINLTMTTGFGGNGTITVTTS